MKSILVAIALAIPSSATAQESIIPGVRLGQSRAEVERVFSGQYLEIASQPGAALITRDDGHVGICQGRVSSVQRKIGSDLHAFTDFVSDRTRDLADPIVIPAHYRTADGEISTLEAEWSFSENRVYKVGIIYSAAGMSVTETMTQLGGPCGGR